MEIFHGQLRLNETFCKIVGQLGGDKNSHTHIGIEGPADSQKAHYIYAIFKEIRFGKCIYVAHNEFAAQRAYDDLSSLSDRRALYLPAQEYILYDIEATSHEIQNKRLDTLFKIQNDEFDILVISAEVLAQRLPMCDKFAKGFIRLTVGEERDVEEFILKLIEIGYERYDTVQGKGQFAKRGGIIDVYPINMAEPVRIDFFGDDVDSIRSFDILSQRSTGEVGGIKIMPAREMYFSSEEKSGFIQDIKSICNKDGKRKAVIENDLERFEDMGYFPGIDRYIPVIFKEYDTVFDYIDASTGLMVVMDEPGRIRENLETRQQEFAESCKNMLEKDLILKELTELYDSFNKFYSQLKEQRVIYLKTLGNFKEEKLNKAKIHTIPARSISGFSENLKVLIEQVKEWKKSGYTVNLLAGNKGRADRLSEMLLGEGVELSATVSITIGSISKSFEYPDMKLIVISDNELFASGVKKGGRKVKRTKGKVINSFTDLALGDFVVHDIHGIGQYMGLEQVTVNNVTRDYIKIKYKDSGFLFVPTNQMDMVQKYIGSEGHTPKLSKLGSLDWAKAKKRVKESLRELAEELVKLYAMRQASKGHAFSADTVWQQEFEESFPYEETEDQLQCVEEIKKDMESLRPMERLLCGDVGYGKTEVALRAAFKAVMDGKQVAFLVPTTVLAQQHYNNFKERFKNFPVTVDYICRFRTAAEQREITKKLKCGEIDILIGTHSLLRKNLDFKDIGLLIVDEEQRFGVGHKEKIKQLKPNIDILTLSATPIPRTLHMSMVQIRDISIIEEPPQERHPVRTYVMEYEPSIIREAMYRELARGGQIFYLYNKVRTIDVKAMELSNMVPEAKICVAHGQMNEHELEQIMLAFMNGEYDVLVCTTIIESGIDMSNVNTLIIEEGDHLGLAQLYQLRGRVGRSNRIAYAYITYKKDKVLTEFSEKRLQTIKEFTEFGSGFKIAMRDLEIRGAGNLLGEQQHGQMESVGYDMYVKLLDKAVKEIKGSTNELFEEEVLIDISVTAYINSRYIPNEEDRLDMYKKISVISQQADVMDVKDEFIDRFGEVPDEVSNLIEVAWIKALAVKAGFASVSENKDLIIFKFMKNFKIAPEKIANVMDKFKRKILFNAGVEPYLAYRRENVSQAKLLKEIEEIISCILL